MVSVRTKDEVMVPHHTMMQQQYLVVPRMQQPQVPRCTEQLCLVLPWIQLN